MEDLLQGNALVRSAAEAHGELDRMPDGSLATNSCYCKILVSNHLAGIIIGQSGHDIRTLKSSTGARIILSPHGMHFPGTSERVAAVEGSEQAVFQVLDWFMEKMAEQRSLGEPHDQHQLLPQPLQPLQQQDAAGPLPVAIPKCSTCVRLCVPRAVVGSLIGKNGGYIQSLRVATGASINISPLFVTADEACAERIVSVDSRRKQCLKTAAFTLVRKINTHPDKASCRHVCYFRKHSFDSRLADPLATVQVPEIRMRHQGPVRQTALRQAQHLEAHHDVENIRRKTVSLVMGTARCPLRIPLPPHQERISLSNQCTNGSNSSANSNIGEKQFAAFKRFCEARIPKNAVAGNSQPQQQQSAQPSLCENMQEVLNSKKHQGVEADQTAPTTAVCAPAAPGIKQSTSWESGISSLCSTAAASTDRLLVLAQMGVASSGSKEEEAKTPPVIPVSAQVPAPTPGPAPAPTPGPAPASTPPAALESAPAPPPPTLAAATTAGLTTSAAAPAAAAEPPCEVPEHVYKRHVRSIATLALIALLMVAIFRLVRTF